MSTLQAKFQRFWESNLNLWKTVILMLFQKSISQSVSILAGISHPLFIMGFNHLSSTALQNKLLFSFKIDICFWDFQNHAKHGDSVPLRLAWVSEPRIEGTVFEIWRCLVEIPSLRQGSTFQRANCWASYSAVETPINSVSAVTASTFCSRVRIADQLTFNRRSFKTASIVWYERFCSRNYDSIIRM